MNDLFVPLMFLVGISATVVVAIGFVHTFALIAGRKSLNAYKDQVVSLSDKIDALKERHKLLPFMSEKFAVPMSGETLTTYQDVSQHLEHHRQAWLQLMEVWEQAEALLNSEWILGNGRARSARRNLRAADAPAALAGMLSECEAPLNRIEQAHAQAAAQLKSYQQQEQQLRTQLESVKAASLATTPYDSERLAAVSLVEKAQEMLAADPLATLRRLGEACNKLSAIQVRATRILEQAVATKEMMKKLTEIQEAAMQRRSQGFLLLEDGANPEPMLIDARQQHTAVLDALNQADDSIAGNLLSKATALIQLARNGLEQHVAAKLRCEIAIPAARAESQRLVGIQGQARVQHAELARDFAADLWLGVAENVQSSQASLAAADQFIAAAISHAAPDRQQYGQAGKLLDLVAERHKHAATELAAIGKRLHELIELRTAFQSQVGQLWGKFDQVNRLLQSRNADRPLVNERFRATRSMFDRLIEDSHLLRPDWTRLTARVREVDVDLDRVEQSAKQDIQLAQQAVNEIAETEKIIRETRSMNDHGVTCDVSAAESQLSQARGCLTAQGYEEAIRLANAAKQMARTAHQDAISRVQLRQQELESQRRTLQAAPMSHTLMQNESTLRIQAEAPWVAPTNVIEQGVPVNGQTEATDYSQWPDRNLA